MAAAEEILCLLRLLGRRVGVNKGLAVGRELLVHVYPTASARKRAEELMRDGWTDVTDYTHARPHSARAPGAVRDQPCTPHGL